MLEIEMALQRGSLCDLVPEVWMLPFQNWPISVCSAVRVVLSMNRDFSLH